MVPSKTAAAVKVIVSFRIRPSACSQGLPHREKHHSLATVAAGDPPIIVSAPPSMRCSPLVPGLQSQAETRIASTAPVSGQMTSYAVTQRRCRPM
jgi:hypothetical protein